MSAPDFVLCQQVLEPRTMVNEWRRVKAQADRLSVLVLGYGPYRYSTRGRKAAASYAQVADTMYLGMAVTGRSWRRGRAGKLVLDGIHKHQGKVGKIWTSSSASTQIQNLLVAYLPAFLRMLTAALHTKADVVHIVNPPLSWIWLIHKWRFGSRVVLDIPERPGRVTLRGSLGAKFSRFEPILLRQMSSRVELAMVVVPSDVSTIERMGYGHVCVVRNAPLQSWRATYRPPVPRASGPLEAVLIGSIFEGRGYQLILRAVALCNADSFRVRLGIYGPGSDRYMSHLRRVAREASAGDAVVWQAALEPSHVSSAYLSAHIGLVLYASVDPGNDGLSNKIVECVSSGRPVLAGDLPENHNFVTSNRVGWLSDMSVEPLARRAIHFVDPYVWLAAFSVKNCMTLTYQGRETTPFSSSACGFALKVHEMDSPFPQSTCEVGAYRERSMQYV